MDFTVDEIEKVRPQCGQPSDRGVLDPRVGHIMDVLSRGRMKNRTSQQHHSFKTSLIITLYDSLSCYQAV